MKTDIVCVVWGEKYTTLMLDFCFPSLLAEGNLPSWPYRADTVLQLYTTPQDAQTIKNHHYYHLLDKHIQIQFHTHLYTNQGEQYNVIFNRMNEGHRDSIRQANQRGASIMYIAPDHVFTANCFKEILSALNSGSELIMTLTPRVDISCQSELRAVRSEVCLTVSAERAAEYVMQYLHPAVKAHFWNTELFNSWSSQVYRYLNSHSLAVQGFHLHPSASE